METAGNTVSEIVPRRCVSTLLECVERRSGAASGRNRAGLVQGVVARFRAARGVDEAKSL